MANVLSNSGIQNNGIIQAAHVSQSVNALTGIVGYDISISGSLNVTGSTFLSGSSTNIRGGALSITSSNFNATLNQGTLNLGYDNNSGVIKTGTVSASFYYVSQSLSYNIITASDALITNLTASNISSSNTIITNLTASFISASNSNITNLTASYLQVTASTILLGRDTTKEILAISGSSQTISTNYDAIKITNPIILGAGGPYNYRIIHISTSIQGTQGSPNVTGSGLYINPIGTSITDNNIWRSIQWDNNQGYGLYGSGSALNYIAGPVEIANNLTSSNLLVNTNLTTTNLTASIISSSNRLITNGVLTTSITASIISASSWISASNIGAQFISASTALTASQITTHTSPSINVTSALTSSIISASSWISASNIGASVISASTALTASQITTFTSPSATITTLTSSIISASSWISASNIGIITTSTEGLRISGIGGSAGPVIAFVTGSVNRVTLGAAFAGGAYAANNVDGDFTIKVRGGNRVGIAYDFTSPFDNSHLFKSSSIIFNNLSKPNFEFKINTLESSSVPLTSYFATAGGPKLLLYDSNTNIIASSGSAFAEIAQIAVLPSDERLKENIYVITSSLDKVKQLRGVTFNWKNKERGEQEEVGVIAQDFLPVLPQILGKSGEYYTVNYSRIAPILIEAIKEQQVIIEHLKSRIEALENQT